MSPVLMENEVQLMKTLMKLGGLLIVGAAVLLAFNAPAAKPGTSGPSPQTTFSTSDLLGSFAFRLVPAESFAPFLNPDTCPNAPDAGVCSAPRQDILRVGVITFDGSGGVTGHTIATTDDGQTTVVKDFNFSGTYTVNPDGTGTLTISPTAPIADEGPETYSFVLNNGDATRPSTVDLAETDNDGGGAKIFLTGKATSLRTELSTSALTGTSASSPAPTASLTAIPNPA